MERTERNISIHIEALSSLIRIVHNMDIVKPLSCVMHPAIQIIAGSPNESFQTRMRKVQSEASINQGMISKHELRLQTLAVVALQEIGMCFMKSFTVFGSVIAKALKYSSERTSNKVYNNLKDLHP